MASSTVMLATALAVAAVVASYCGGQVNSFPLSIYTARNNGRSRPRQSRRGPLAESADAAPATAPSAQPTGQDEAKSRLLDLLARVPKNKSTPRDQTNRILETVKRLECDFPTPESDVLPLIAGNWELIWTAQDSLSLTERRFDNLFGFINPLENQSYSNNPGRSNPILPREIQDGLEGAGVLSERGDNSAVSTQAIDLKRGRIRNVVAFQVNNPTPILRSRDDRKTKGFVTVDVLGSPNPSDGRRIDVKFDSCRVNVMDSPVDLRFPLGIIGPTGWLRTLYVDENLRITRGHKGSVFILSRTSK